MRFKGEASLNLENAANTFELALDGLKPYCRSMSRSSRQYELDFGTALATIRADERRLLIRVESDELIGCYSAEMLVQCHINQHTADMPRKVLWTNAGSIPFETICANITSS